MEKSSQIAWKIVPLRHFFQLKVVPLIEVVLYSNLATGSVAEEFEVSIERLTNTHPPLFPSPRYMSVSVGFLCITNPT
jgi:hypothetical protein